VTPVVAIDLKRDERSNVGDRLGVCEVVLRLLRLIPLQGGQLGRVSAQGVLVSIVGCEPECVADGLRVVVGGDERGGAVSASSGGVALVIADAYGDANYALMVGLLLDERAEVGDGFVEGHVVEPVLDEVGLEHARKDELCLLAGELCLHRGEDGVGGSVLTGGRG